VAKPNYGKGKKDWLGKKQDWKVETTHATLQF
jgi:hypothetical protein